MMDKETFRASIEIVRSVMEDEIVVRAFKQTEELYKGGNPILLEFNEESFRSAVLATIESMILHFEKIKSIIAKCEE